MELWRIVVALWLRTLQYQKFDQILKSQNSLDPISYSIHYFVTADDEIIASETNLSLFAHLLFFLEFIKIAHDDDP